MARTGGFGGGLNPYGTGSLGSFSQYDIGNNLQDLARYKAEVAWGNGLLSDDAYLAVLADVVANTTSGSKEQVSAQNALDDATYTIGRSRADAEGLDALIAFDQGALAKMVPTNNKYRSVKNALDSELAQRRSRDYGKLVDQYNEGRIATAVLMTWVQNTLGGLSQDAPDYDNWQSTLASLKDRAQTEKDSEVYQDYQMGRMTAPDFLAYLKGRRDSYAVDSPDYADWNRRLEDETKTATTNEQNAKDSAFFDLYNEGKKSDKDYLAYIKARLDSMSSDDPAYEDWRHRYATASFSIAEDQLIFDVNEGKKPISDLVSFYRAYQKTLNPGSAEWRSVQTHIESALKAGGGSGGGGRGGSSSPPGGGYTPTDTTSGKIISPKFTLETAMSLMQLPANASKELIANFNLNYASLMNAWQRGDATWTFYDPRHPGQSVALPVTSDALGRLDGSKAQYNADLANLMFAKGNNKKAYEFAKTAIEAWDAQRGHNIQASRRNTNAILSTITDQIKQFTRLGDDASVFNLASAALDMIDQTLTDPTLDDSARASLETKRETFANNPVMPVEDPLHPGTLINRAIDAANSTFDAQGNMVQAALAPGWHRVFDTSSTTGEQALKLVYDDGQAGAWDATHLPIHINVGDRVVTAEAKVEQSAYRPPLTVTDDQGMQAIIPGAPPLLTVVYFDGHGNKTQAYSLDGNVWVTSASGALPVLELTVPLTKRTNGDGTIDYLDPDGNLLGSTDANGNWTKALAPPAGSVKIFGQDAAENYAQNVATGAAKSGYQYSTAAALPSTFEAYAASHDFGAPGQHMGLALLGPDNGIVQFGSDWRTPTQVSDEELASYRGEAFPVVDHPYSQGYVYSSGSKAVGKAAAAKAKADAAALAAATKLGYVYSSGSPAIAAAAAAPKPSAGYMYSSASALAPRTDTSAGAAVTSLLLQLGSAAGAFMTGVGLKPTPVPPPKTILPKNAYVYSSGSPAIAAAVPPPLKSTTPIVKQVVTKPTIVKPGTEYSKGYVYSSGSPAIAKAATPPPPPVIKRASKAL